MKKIKLLGLGLLLSITLFSCSKDGESSSSQASLILPKKVSEGVDETYYTYDGNKIVSENYQVNYKSVYTYTGNLITKIESFYYAKLLSTYDFTYTNGKITSMLDTEPPYAPIMTTYIHNTDGTILFSSSNKDEGKLTFKDGNLIEWYSKDVGSTKIYEYDTKNHPFRNILGFSALSGIMFTGSNKNNIIKMTAKTNGFADESGKTIITYNSDGYPIESQGYWNGSSSSVTTKYYYE